MVKNTILFETEESEERIQELKLDWVHQEGGVIDK